MNKSKDDIIEEIDTILINNGVSFYEAIGILETVKQVLFEVAKAKEEKEERLEKKEEIYEYFR